VTFKTWLLCSDEFFFILCYCMCMVSYDFEIWLYFCISYASRFVWLLRGWLVLILVGNSYSGTIEALWMHLLVKDLHLCSAIKICLRDSSSNLCLGCSCHKLGIGFDLERIQGKIWFSWREANCRGCWYSQ